MKPTFKKNDPTGRYRSFQASSTDIKVKRMVCGSISEASEGWRVGFMTTAKKQNENCPWGWIFIKQRFASEQVARDWVTQNIDSVNEKYPLHFQE